jgi:hypothetical protein
MQQRERGLSRHSSIAIGCAGADAFEQAEDRPNSRNRVERADQWHFGCAGICETDFYSGGHSGSQNAFSSVHLPPDLDFGF